MKHLLLITVVLLAGCAELKGVGRTIGHTTRDVTREIGHTTRDVTREIGHGTRDTVNGIGNEIKNK
ncbi:hypothetical protein ACKC5O_11310 [Aeromonas schubertii]|uniref:Lipoprotein n=1 Tax=Aeromonas schubertii TaxID=652 RepID=A0A0S2SHS7_9GAMM|nr:hypothetical protein [Aeromonas schubertii]ALP41256.1 hypothetical protein WL1483_1837 [Aeromonas schubertii]KUE79446.1 hypothetical protein ATO46_05350 [Aeromonas schubertii]MBZ6066747.1 hypothetical protein [Aeromonas schubertii]MBZ6072210.1 hypothetical protein [Aeromonas schubertii]